MGRTFKPSSPFDAAMKLLIPTESKAKGVTKKDFPDPSKVDEVFFGSFRTFGGTETLVNNVYTVEDTATINTWFNPAITSDCRIYLCDTGEQWDVLGRPEDIDMRHQYMQIKVKKVGGMP